MEFECLGHSHRGQPLQLVFLVQPAAERVRRERERERVDPDQLKQRQQEVGSLTVGAAYQACSCPNNPASCLECSQSVLLEQKYQLVISW